MGDRGHREIVYVPSVYVPFLAPRATPETLFQHFLEFRNTAVLNAVVLNASLAETRKRAPKSANARLQMIGHGPNTAAESTVSDTELSESFGSHRVPGRELSEFLSA